MIERLNIQDKSKHSSLLEFIKTYTDEDFYYTLNNDRIYIQDFPELFP